MQFLHSHSRNKRPTEVCVRMWEWPFALLEWPISVTSGANYRLWAERQSLTGQLKTNCAGDVPPEICALHERRRPLMKSSMLKYPCHYCPWTTDELFHALRRQLGEAVWLRVASGWNAVADAPVAPECVELMDVNRGPPSDQNLTGAPAPKKKNNRTVSTILRAEIFFRSQPLKWTARLRNHNRCGNWGLHG